MNHNSLPLNAHTTDSLLIPVSCPPGMPHCAHGEQEAAGAPPVHARLWRSLWGRMGVWSWDAALDQAACSEALPALLGQPGAAAPATCEALLAFIHPGDRLMLAKAIRQALQEQRWRYAEVRAGGPGTAPRWLGIHGCVERGDGGGAGQLMLLLADLADRAPERERADDLARLLDALLEAIPVPVFYKDAESRYRGCNPAFAALFGRAKEDIIGTTMQELVPSGLAQGLRTNDLDLLRQPGVRRYRKKLRRPDSQQCSMQFHKATYTNAAGAVAGIVGVLMDDSDLHRIRVTSARLQRALQVLSRCNSLLVHGEDEHQLAEAVCRVIVEDGGYRMAWLGRQRDDAAKAVEPVACHGDGEGFLKNVSVSWADDALGNGTVGTAVRNRATQVNQNFQTNPRMAPWRAEAARFGYQSNVALPLLDGERMHGVLVIYAAEPDAFDRDELRLLQELADDLAFGITTLRMRAERDRMAAEQEQHAAQLRQSLVDSIQALASLVEQRDPYTAGHQRRVARLAAALARETGLPDDRIEGLRLAAIIHDIGKVHVPAEILNHPGKLDPIQWELVKTHAQIGHDIVNDIRFPWPIARMVAEHHERIDGSGYPQGLRGEQMLAESRLLVIADVVEAMTSHRPYRAALGIDAALEEIARHRGAWYDPAGVDACLRLFRERRFSFEETAGT